MSKRKNKVLFYLCIIVMFFSYSACYAGNLIPKDNVEYIKGLEFLSSKYMDWGCEQIKLQDNGTFSVADSQTLRNYDMEGEEKYNIGIWSIEDVFCNAYGVSIIEDKHNKGTVYNGENLSWPVNSKIYNAAISQSYVLLRLFEKTEVCDINDGSLYWSIPEEYKYFDVDDYGNAACVDYLGRLFFIQIGGKVKWTDELQDDPVGLDISKYGGVVAVITNGDSSLKYFDKDGNCKWTHRFANDVNNVVLLDDFSVMVTTSGDDDENEIMGFDPEGNKEFTTILGYKPKHFDVLGDGSLVAITSESTVYFYKPYKSLNI